MLKTVVLYLVVVMSIGVCAQSSGGKLEELARGRIAGVTNVKSDENGDIRSLLIIGRANLNKILDEDDAEMDARDDAEINASIAFTEYLNKNVDVARRRDNATQKSALGTEKNDVVDKSSSVSQVSKKSQEFSSISKAAVSGMKEIYAGVFNNKYVIIYAWDKVECRGMKDVILTMSAAAQTAVKEAKDTESRLASPLGYPQIPVPPAPSGQGMKRRSGNVQEGGSASPDADKYL